MASELPFMTPDLGCYDVEITADDIANGVCRSPWACPVGRAVARAIGIKAEYGEIDVDGYGLCINVRGGWRRTSKDLPRKLRRFVERFDKGWPVKPLKFKLKLSV